MGEFDTTAFFTDESLLVDPYSYYAQHRSQCPVSFDSQQGILAVTGYDDAMEVYRDVAGFSAWNAVIGPFAGLPFEPAGDKTSAARSPDIATRCRSATSWRLSIRLSMGVSGVCSAGSMTPRRLKENQAFMWSLADRQLDEFVESGSCEFFRQYAQPFSLLVIADLLGVPTEDHGAFKRQLSEEADATSESQAVEHNPLHSRGGFTAYIQDRRRDPGDDVLTALAQAKYPDGSTPEVVDVVRLSTFLSRRGRRPPARCSPLRSRFSPSIQSCSSN